MGKYDPEQAGNGRRRKVKNPRFRDQYDENFSDEDLADMFSRKKKGNKSKRRRSQTEDWEDAN
ncbi:MAG TPA: hypothetical protein DHV36_21090 [Desulfobacteraceae bacterium]|nr:hypothetical protein [Desulfobacteraceae bacterium]|tara:strand:+ start:590 stop:778 length:189 start_codon:yes stop_codon:yes gene_type:complete